MAGNTWDDVDFPVLRWVFEESQDAGAKTGDFPLNSDAPSVVEGVSHRDLSASLARLEDHGLIDGVPMPAMGLDQWQELRPTADGLRVLGEWPPASAADTNRAIVLILEQLAEETDDPAEAKIYRRGAGAIGRFAGSLVADVAKGELRRLGGDVAG